MPYRLTSETSGSRALIILRVAALAAWALIALEVLAAEFARPGVTILSPRVAASIVVLALFGAALWSNLSRGSGPRATRRGVLLLVLQTALTLLSSTDLFYVLALELPLVLPPRHAATWFGGQVALTLAIGAVLAAHGRFQVTASLAGLPIPLQVALSLGSTLAWQLLAFAGGYLAATEIRAHAEVRRLMAELRATTGLLAESSRLAERGEIARELHDTVGHRLAALGVHFDLASRSSDEPAAGIFREARDSVRTLLGEVREVVADFRHQQPLDLKRAIARLLEETAGVNVDVAISPGLEVIDPAVAHALFRCAQEALTNVVRHARASRVRLEIRQDASGTTLEVRDDGRGAPRLVEGNGLRGMRERLEALGGSLTLQQDPGPGLTVRAWLPPREREAGA